jgi:hypothetical protein
VLNELSEVAMPSSAVRTFSDRDESFAGIQNLQSQGLVERSGEFRVEATHIDLHRLWIHRFNGDLLRIMKNLRSECARCPTRKIVRPVVGALPASVSYRQIGDYAFSYVSPRFQARGQRRKGKSAGGKITRKEDRDDRDGRWCS